MIHALYDRSFFPGPYFIKQSNENAPMALFENPPTDYTLEFNITMIPAGTKLKDYNSIIHFRNNSKDESGGYGNRCPAIWLKKNSKLLIVTGTSENSNEGRTLNFPLPWSQEHELKLQVEDELASFFINGTIVDNWVVGARAPIAELKMYIGDPWYPALPGEVSKISNIRYFDNKKVSNTIYLIFELYIIFHEIFILNFY